MTAKRGFRLFKKFAALNSRPAAVADVEGIVHVVLGKEEWQGEKTLVIQLDISDDGEFLRIRAMGGGTLTIEPIASNDINIGVRY